MAQTPVLLVLGAGNRVGQHVTRAFAAKGYKIALVSRTPKDKSTADQVNIRADLSNPESVIEVFAKTTKSLGIPSVVIYNGEHPFKLASR